MKEFIITEDEVENVLGNINLRKTLVAKNILKNLKEFKKNEIEIKKERQAQESKEI